MESVPRRARLGFKAAIGSVIGLWAVYTVIQTLSVVYDLAELWSGIVGFVPGLLAVGVLLAWLNGANMVQGGSEGFVAGAIAVYGYQLIKGILNPSE